MEKEIFDEFRSRIEELQNQLDTLRRSLEAALSEPAGSTFTEPVDISLDVIPSFRTDTIDTMDTMPVSEPEQTEPEIAEPETEEPVQSETETSGPDAEEPVQTEPETTVPGEESTKPEPTKESTLDYRWAKDIPGNPVSNVISGISLNDRVLLINTLFNEDPMAFQYAITSFNGMSSLEEAVQFVTANFPDWNLNSETVYRLMMAVRRKLN